MKEVYKRNALIAAQNYLHHKAMLGPITKNDFDWKSVVNDYNPFLEKDDQEDFHNRLENYIKTNGLSNPVSAFERQTKAINQICFTLKKFGYDFSDKGRKFEDELNTSISICRKTYDEPKFDQIQRLQCERKARGLLDEKVASQKKALFEVGRLPDFGALVFTKEFSDLVGAKNVDNVSRASIYTNEEYNLYEPRRLNPDFSCDNASKLDPNNTSHHADPKYKIIQKAVEQSNEISNHYMFVTNKSFKRLRNLMNEIEYARKKNPNIEVDPDLIAEFRKLSKQLIGLNPRAVGEAIMMSSSSEMVPFICDLLHSEFKREAAVEDLKDMGKASIIIGGMVALGAFAAPILTSNALIVGAAEGYAASTIATGTNAALGAMDAYVTVSEYQNNQAQFKKQFMSYAVTGSTEKFDPTEMKKYENSEGIAAAAIVGDALDIAELGLVVDAGKRTGRAFLNAANIPTETDMIPVEKGVAALLKGAQVESHILAKQMDELVIFLKTNVPQIQPMLIEAGGEKIFKCLNNSTCQFRARLKHALEMLEKTNAIDEYAFFLAFIGKNDLDDQNLRYVLGAASMSPTVVSQNIRRNIVDDQDIAKSLIRVGNQTNSNLNLEMQNISNEQDVAKPFIETESEVNTKLNSEEQNKSRVIRNEQNVAKSSNRNEKELSDSKVNAGRAPIKKLGLLSFIKNNYWGKQRTPYQIWEEIKNNKEIVEYLETIKGDSVRQLYLTAYDILKNKFPNKNESELLIELKKLSEACKG